MNWRSAAWRDGGLFLLGLALWLAIHPYSGIWHDARLYAVMALKSLAPAAYAHDPWFTFGKQDGMSLFTPLFAWLTRWVGLGEAARGLALFGGVAYCLGCWMLTRACQLDKLAALAFLLLVSVPLAYCPNDWMITRLTEAFATPRPLAIALSLMALASQRLGYRTWPWLLHGLALLLHPLMASGPLALAIGLRLSERRMARLLAGFFILVIAGILLGIPALRAMDGYWLNLVTQTGVIVVMPGMDHDQTLIIAASAVLLLAVGQRQDEMRRGYLLALIIGFLGYVITLVASRFYPSALVLQVQPWRALWLTLVFAVIAFCDLAGRWQNGDRLGRSALLLAASTLLLLEHGGAHVLLGAAIGLHYWRRAIVRRVEKIPLRWFWHGSQAIFVVSLLSELPSLALIFKMHGMALAKSSSLPWLGDDWRGFLDVGGFGLLALLVWLLWRYMPRRAGIVLAVSVCVFALFQWDQRTVFSATLENRFQGDAQPEYFSSQIRRGDVVYWQGNPERTWFELRTASYAGSVQAVGIVFSRAHALEIERRLSRVAQVGVPDGLFRDARVDDPDRLAYKRLRHPMQWPDDLHAIAALAQLADSRLSPASLAYLCADPALDWVIDRTDLPLLATAHAEIPVRRFDHVRRRDCADKARHALYDCRGIRLSAVSGRGF